MKMVKVIENLFDVTSGRIGTRAEACYLCHHSLDVHFCNWCPLLMPVSIFPSVHNEQDGREQHSGDQTDADVSP